MNVRIFHPARALIHPSLTAGKFLLKRLAGEIQKVDGSIDLTAHARFQRCPLLASTTCNWPRTEVYVVSLFYCNKQSSGSSECAAISAWALRRRSPQPNKSRRILRLSAPSYVRPRAPQWREQSHTSAECRLLDVRLTESVAPQTQGFCSAEG